MRLDELLDTRLLAQEVNDGYVTAREHPRLPLVIYNYTSETAFENRWNEVTLQCRGLIVNYHTKEVVARPFKKFFNGPKEDSVDIECLPDHLWGETTPVEVVDKIDGSLGILYPDGSKPTGWAVATRGSFTSDQALRATEMFQRQYEGYVLPIREYTLLFEIVYPENRIVVNYGKSEALYYLGAVNIETGKILSGVNVPIMQPRVFPFKTYGEFIRGYQPKGNTEGVVVRNLVTDELRKFKTEEYVRLHKFINHLSATRVWEMLKNDERLNDWLSMELPLHVIKWMEGVELELLKAYGKIRRAVNDFFLEHDTHVPRKEFAQLVRLEAKVSIHHLLFKKYDGRPIDQLIWKMIKPTSSTAPMEN